MSEDEALLSSTSNLPDAVASAASRIQVFAASAGAALLGLTLLWGVGFSHIDAVHNAAHDARHSAGFPCH